MSGSKLYKRTMLLVAVILATVIVFIYFIITKSSAIQGLSLKTDELKESVISKEYRKETLEGTITDTNGVILSEAVKAGDGGVIIYPELYSWLLGYNDTSYGTYGLKGKYENYLYMQGKDKRGATLTLTIDNDIQKLAYQLIEGTNGSMIVMEKDTGKILALASSREEGVFNANELDQMSQWNDVDGFLLANGYKDKAEPGSVFKVITSTALIEQEMDKDIVNDEGVKYFGDHKVINLKERARGEISLQEALGYSSNIYFATMSQELGGALLNDIGRDFLLGETIELDFTTLYSNYDLGDYEQGLVVDTSFGQGRTLVTPLHLAMIYQSIANEGKMLKPYLVEKVTLDDKVIYKGKKEVLTETTDKKTAKKLDEYLKVVGSDYYEIEKYSVRAKTGTAQIAGGTSKSYFASYNDDYVIIVSKVADEGYGAHLKDEALKMYQYLTSK